MQVMLHGIHSGQLAHWLKDVIIISFTYQITVEAFHIYGCKSGIWNLISKMRLVYSQTQIRSNPYSQIQVRNNPFSFCLISDVSEAGCSLSQESSLHMLSAF